MGLPQPSNQDDDPSLKPFLRLLAEYRARVYETHFLAQKPQSNLMHALANDPTPAPTPTILVIEDNVDQWFLTRWALLQRYAKAQTHWLSSANEVIPYLDTCRQTERDLPQMILVDLYLPSVQQGLAVLQSLKAHPLYQSIPAITLSWSNGADDITQAFTHSADGYLVKPTGYQDWLVSLSLLDRYLNRPTVA